MTTTIDADVIVVGAGPAGSTAPGAPAVPAVYGVTVS